MRSPVPDNLAELLAIEKLGLDAVLAKIRVEPSGEGMHLMSPGRPGYSR